MQLTYSSFMRENRGYAHNRTIFSRIWGIVRVLLHFYSDVVNDFSFCGRRGPPCRFTAKKGGLRGISWNFLPGMALNDRQTAKKLPHLAMRQFDRKPRESSRGPQPSRISIVPGGMYGGGGRFLRREIPFPREKITSLQFSQGDKPGRFVILRLSRRTRWFNPSD